MRVIVKLDDNELHLSPEWPHMFNGSLGVERKHVERMPLRPIPCVERVVPESECDDDFPVTPSSAMCRTWPLSAQRHAVAINADRVLRSVALPFLSKPNAEIALTRSRTVGDRFRYLRIARSASNAGRLRATAGCGEVR
jgi:hypothetical protein